MEIIIQNLTKSYGSLPVLSHLDLHFTSARPCCLMSPSGSGKTTLFRILMGLEQADGGSLRFTENGHPCPSIPASRPSFKRIGSARPSPPWKMCAWPQGVPSLPDRSEKKWPSSFRKRALTALYLP